MPSQHKILVIRNDKLGDFMLAWPALALLKAQYPGSIISALVPDYTRPVAEMCPWIDELLIEPGRASFIKNIFLLSNLIKQQKFDCSISLFSQTTTSLALWLARVPKRYGPASKLAQIFLNRRLVQRRSKSLKPEFEYNLDLARYVIADNGDTHVQVPKPPFLTIDRTITEKRKQAFLADNKIRNTARLVAIHPGSGGSAGNLTLEQYSTITHTLYNCEEVFFIITAGPEEYELASRLSALMEGIEHIIYHSTKGLGEFSAFLSICDMFISGSTGVLHIAGAMDIPTAAFYTNRRSATSLRWQTLNREENRLSFSPPDSAPAEDMSSIDAESAANIICKRLNEV
jgi:ADP-heptose:LPS heptosyltransferase